MSVLERTDEIGTLRAMGLRRARIRQQFLLEGAVIGLVGATIGLALAYLCAVLINMGGLTWTPPGNSQPVPLKLYMGIDWSLTSSVWLGLIVVTILSSVTPAFRAARLSVVNALRHV